MASAAELAKLSPLKVGNVEIRPDTREVTSAAGSEVVEPRVMQVLIRLVEAAGRIVTRDELVRDCWDNRAVSDDAISRVIQRLRRVSEHVGGFAIKTVHKVGYRLVEAEHVAVPLPQSAAPVPNAQPASRHWLTRRAVIGGAVLVGGLAAWRGWSDPRAREVEALIARSELAQRTGLPEADAQGVRLLEQAVRISPGDARAWGRLALARAHAAEYAPSARATYTADAQTAAQRALALTTDQIDAQSALAILPPIYGAWSDAERRLREVLRSDPGHLPTRDALNFLLGAVGRCREASADRFRMAAADPLHVGYLYKLIYAHWTIGEISAADRAADRARQLQPRHPGAWFGRLWLLAFTGRADRALEQLGDAGSAPTLPPETVPQLRATLRAIESGRKEDIEAVGRTVVEQVSVSPSASIHGIMILSHLGRLDQAFDVADAYLLERGSLLASLRWRPGQASLNDQRRRKTQMLFIPPCAPMRADPRFNRLVEDVGLADYWRKAGAKPDYRA